MVGIKCVLEVAMKIVSLELIVSFKVKYALLIETDYKMCKKGCPLQENQRNTDVHLQPPVHNSLL